MLTLPATQIFFVNCILYRYTISSLKYTNIHVDLYIIFLNTLKIKKYSRMIAGNVKYVLVNTTNNDKSYIFLNDN